MRENDLFRNTWIIFTSDHGEMLGDHHMSQKNLFFEGSAHVPLLIVPPAGSGIPHNLTVDSLTEIADIYPTILELAGVTPPEGITGRSSWRRKSCQRTVFFMETACTPTSAS